MHTVILALVALLQMDSVQPHLVKPFNSLEECSAAANKLNATDEGLREAKAREIGLAFVCMPVVLPL